MAKIRVLVVDDSATMRGLITAALNRDSEIEVVGAAGDPFEARGMIKALNPDVVTLDIEMPNMNGIDFLRELRKLPGGEQPIVVFCTTENDIEHIQEAISAGANEYIMKPFDSEIMQAKFSQVGLL